jgi:glycosyltransferase involved in cell wall biosynthesis
MVGTPRVCFDVIGAQELAWDRGIPRFIVEHGKALLARDDGYDIALRADPFMPLMPPAQQFVSSGRLHRTRRSPWGDADGTPAVFHITSPFELPEPLDVIWPTWARTAEWRTVATVWDLIPLLVPGYLREGELHTTVYRQRLDLLRALDHLLAISQHTAADVEEHLGVPASKITVIDAGVDLDRFGTLEGAEAREIARGAVPGLRDRFLFYVGGDDARKNMEGLIRAYGRSAARRAGVQLVLGGTISPPRLPHFDAIAVDAGVQPGDLVIAGHVDDRVLAALYRTCTVFVFPSLYEGSGLPMLEAMAAGAPVIAANTSTGPEIVGGLDGTFDPADPADMARVIDRATSDSAWLATLRRRSAERVRGYTWDHVASQSVKGYDAALSAGPMVGRARRRDRGRLAVVSPMPPERSGIADYTARLVSAMRRHEHRPIDIVVADHSPAPRATGVIPEQAFRAAVALGANYEAVLFQVGNSGFHAHMLDLMPWAADHGLPVAAMVHEARLSGILTDGVRSGAIDQAQLVGAVRERYGVLATKPGDELVPFLEEDGLTHGILMSGAATRGAGRILTHSLRSRDLLLLDRGDDPGPPIVVVPFGAPDPPRESRDRVPGLIVSTGIVAEIKDVGTLIQAFALVRARRPDARLVLAGSHFRDDVVRFRSLITELDLDEAVDLPGYVTDAERWDLLATASVAVQLRRHSQGEASAAVMDALSAGAPTLVTDIGWMSELPDDAVCSIPAEPAPATLADALLDVLETPGRADELSRGASSFAAERAFSRIAGDVLDGWLGTERPQIRPHGDRSAT